MTRNIALDMLKLSLAFMVVGIHAKFLTDLSPLLGYLTVNGLFRIAVPLFLLINGFYFFSIFTQEKTLIWFKRVFYLYLFWMLFYSYFWFRPKETSLIELVKFAFVGYNHLWYLPGMIGAATISIFFIKKTSTIFTVSSIFLFFLIGVSIQYIGSYHLIENTMLDQFMNYDWVYRNFLFFAFPFFAIGFLINKFKIHKFVSIKTALQLSVIGCILLLGESYLNYVEPFRDGGFDIQLSLLILCPALFLFFINMEFKGDNKNITLYSSGIYFIHYFFLHVYRKIVGFDETILTLVTIISSIIASYILIIINKKYNFII